MKKNMGTIDKVIRVLVAVVVLILYFTHVISGILAVILLILAGVLVVTSLLGFCSVLFTCFLVSVPRKKNKGTGAVLRASIFKATPKSPNGD